MGKLRTGVPPVGSWCPTSVSFLTGVQCGLLNPSWHCYDTADIYELSFSMQYGILHMSSTVTLHVFGESEDLFPSKSLLLAFYPSLPNCQEMNFNLEELLHLSLWICSTMDKFEDLCLFPNGALRISLELRKFTLDFLFTVLRKRVLKCAQSPCSGSGSLPLSQPGDIWAEGRTDVTHLWGAGRLVLDVPRAMESSFCVCRWPR